MNSQSSGSSAYVDQSELEIGLAALEHGAAAYTFISGQTAVGAVLDLLDKGTHVILAPEMQGARYRFFEDMRRRTSGLVLSYVDPTDRQALMDEIREETRMIWIENPFGSELRMADCAMVVDMARQHELISVCDNTYLTPCRQRPIENGFDIVVHSAPGYLFGGVLTRGGAVILGPEREFLIDKLGFQRVGLGTAMSVDDQVLAAIGLATLQVRMERVTENAERLAAMLENHPNVKAVYHPHRGGVLSFVRDGGLHAAEQVLNRLALFERLEGPLGLVSSVEHPVLMHFASVPSEIRTGMALRDGLFRLWCGVEDTDELLRDLQAALF